jgi:peptide/nickel transport system permease protein
MVIGLPLGVISATRRGRWADRAATVFSSMSAAMPAFWLGYLLLLLLAFLPALHLGIGVLPIGGYQFLSPAHLFLPALTLGIVSAPYFTRLLRASLLEELGQQYVLVARGKGMSERRVVWSHAMRNALNPVVTEVGLQMGLLLGGVIVVERVFSWPGLGKLAVDSVANGDVPVIMGTVLLATVVIVLANLLADVVNALFDPRIRLSR